MTLEINWRKVEGILSWNLSFFLETGNSSLLRVEIWECYQGLEEATLALLWINHWVCSVAKLCLTLCDPMDCMQPTRVLCPWNFPDKNTGMGCHFLLQWIFPTHGSKLSLLCLLHWQVNSLLLCHQRSPLQYHALLYNHRW